MGGANQGQEVPTAATAEPASNTEAEPAPKGPGGVKSRKRATLGKGKRCAIKRGELFAVVGPDETTSHYIKGNLEDVVLLFGAIQGGNSKEGRTIAIDLLESSPETVAKTVIAKSHRLKAVPTGDEPAMLKAAEMRKIEVSGGMAASPRARRRLSPRSRGAA